MSDAADGYGAARSLPLILARELASNLATPMFLIDERGTLVFYNDAAALVLGKPFTELGEIPADQFADHLQMNAPNGKPIRTRFSPAGVAFFQHKPAHRRLWATMYDGSRRLVEATAYPLFGTQGEMHGVVSVFWETPEPQGAS